MIWVFSVLLLITYYVLLKYHKIYIPKNNIVFSYLYFILKCEYFNDILLIKDRLEFCESVGYAWFTLVHKLIVHIFGPLVFHL